MRKMFFLFATALVFSLLSTSNLSASLIAQYTFDDFSLSDSSGSATSYDLGAVGATPNLSKQAYYSDGKIGNYLEKAPAYGPNPDWTFSLWVNTGVRDQGKFKGLFSNYYPNPSDHPTQGDASKIPYSWQLDSHNGEYRLFSTLPDGGSKVKNLTFIIGTPTLDTWENIIIQKVAGDTARVYLNGGLVGETGYNPGGLQNFRLGTNRNSNNSFTGYLDKVQIWDDSGQDALAIFNAGPGVNQPIPAPEPSTLILLGVGCLGLWGWSKRSRK